MCPSDSDDIADVIRQEKVRGRKRPYGKDSQAHRDLVRGYKDILRTWQWEDVVTALGLQKGTPEYEDSRQTWMAYRSDCAEAERKRKKPKR